MPLAGALNKPNSDNYQYFCPLFCTLFGAILSPILRLKLSAKTFYAFAPYSSQTIRGYLVTTVNLYHGSHPAFPAMRPHSLDREIVVRQDIYYRALACTTSRRVSEKCACLRRGVLDTLWSWRVMLPRLVNP